MLAPVIAIGKVTGIGPTLNSARTGDSMGSAGSPTYYGVAQVDDVAVERYLKGTGPATIHPMQIEGTIRAPVTPTADSNTVNLATLAAGDKPPPYGSIGRLQF